MPFLRMLGAILSNPDKRGYLALQSENVSSKLVCTFRLHQEPFLGAGVEEERYTAAHVAATAGHVGVLQELHNLGISLARGTRLVKCFCGCLCLVAGFLPSFQQCRKRW